MKSPTFLLPKAWKGTPFGRGLPVYAIIGSTPDPAPPPRQEPLPLSLSFAQFPNECHAVVINVVLSPLERPMGNPWYRKSFEVPAEV